MLRLTQKQRKDLIGLVRNSLIIQAETRTFLFMFQTPPTQYINKKQQYADRAKALIANAFKLEQIKCLQPMPTAVSEAEQSLLSHDDKAALENIDNEDNIKRNITTLTELITSLDKNTKEKSDELVHCIPGKMKPADRVTFINQQKTRLKDIKVQLEGMQKIFEEQLNPTPPSPINSYL